MHMMAEFLFTFGRVVRVYARLVHDHWKTWRQGPAPVQKSLMRN